MLSFLIALLIFFIMMGLTVFALVNGVIPSSNQWSARKKWGIGALFALGYIVIITVMFYMVYNLGKTGINISFPLPGSM